MTTKQSKTTPTSIMVARIYMRVSTDEQDLARQVAIVGLEPSLSSKFWLMHFVRPHNARRLP